MCSGSSTRSLMVGSTCCRLCRPTWRSCCLIWNSDPRPLPDLRCVSVTGEALKRELTQRWFGCQPGIKLVNAYGLTETSDDTNHEVMDRVPDGDRVPLGRPVNNVQYSGG